MERHFEPLFLPKSPLVFTLGTIHYDPVLAINKYIPDIQEDLRKNGFPKFRERTVKRRIVSIDEQKIELASVKQWEFYDPQNMTSVLVDQESVGVQTTNYTTYEAFEKLLRLALLSVASRIGVNDVNRCGLRYVDVVDQPDEGSITDWIHSHLLGFQQLDGFSQVHNHTATQLKGDADTTLIVKTTLAPLGIVLPPDLLPCDLGFRANPRKERPFVILDLDHFSESQFGYELDLTLAQLGMLHDGLDRAFRASVTVQAIEQWKQA
jgi:uncharacterized protein (TIGR04255 family)